MERHGTHFIESAIVGGKLELSTIVDKTFSNTSDSIAASATLAFKKAFGLDSFTATASVEYDDIVTRWETETQMTLKVRKSFVEYGKLILRLTEETLMFPVSLEAP